MAIGLSLALAASILVHPACMRSPQRRTEVDTPPGQWPL
jgi:hypothetical protein